MQSQLERLDRRVVLADKWLTHAVDKVRLPNGNVLETYHVVEYSSDSVGVVLENHEGKVLLVQALRYPTKSLEWELPAGSMEAGETPEQAIKREVFEETGYIVGACAFLCEFQPMNDLTPKVVKLLVGKLEGGQEEVVGRADDNEVVEARWFSQEELKQMIATNEIRDGLTIIGLLRWWWQVEQERKA